MQRRLKNNRFGTFEPLPGGDRQKRARVAKADHSMQEDALKSVCRELSPWRWLHEGRACIVCVCESMRQACQTWRLERILPECASDPIRPALSRKQRTNQSCSMPGQFAQGV